MPARSLARLHVCLLACLLACLCLQWQDSRPLIRFITGKDLPLRATSIGSGRTMAVKILEPYPTDRTLPPARPHCELRPSNIIIGALGCIWKPQSSRLRLSKTYYFGDTFYINLFAETPGNPWKPFGNPFGNPSETPSETLRNPSSTPFITPFRTPAQPLKEPLGNHVEGLGR